MNKLVSYKDFVSGLNKYIDVNNAPFEYMGFVYKNKNSRNVKTIAVTLDLCADAVKLAIEKKADILLCFHSPDDLKSSELNHKMIRNLVHNKLSVYKAHLPINFSRNGLHEIMGQMIGFSAKPITFKYEGKLITGGAYKIQGSYSLEEVRTKLKVFGGHYIRIYNKKSDDYKYKRIVISSGSGFKKELLDQIRPDLIISGEAKHGMIIKARDMGITLIELGHFFSENEPMKEIANRLRKVLNLNIVYIDLPFKEEKYEF